MKFTPYVEPKPIAVETWYDRHIRSWVSILVDKNNYQIGDACFDGTRADRDASIAALKRLVK